MGADKQARNSLPSEGLSNSFSEANDMECGLVSYDTSVDDLDKLEQNSVVKVKGRLRENIAFWRSIGASQWLLNVLCKGYCLPFVDFPVNMFFSNHKSASCMLSLFLLRFPSCLNQVPLWKCCLLICVSATHLAVNQHLRSCKFKYEDVRTAATCSIREIGFLNLTSGYHHLEIFPYPLSGLFVVC